MNNASVDRTGPAEGPGGSSEATASRIMDAWIRLETALRAALPVCSVQPPTQPTELLSALRINHRIGPDEETRILALRELRNRVAHTPVEPTEEEAEGFEAAVNALIASVHTSQEERC